ncbi:Ribonuclease H-like superfamily protein [Gossypium australe]|uniref:Ribonuclease H-like superfamily protein n=1 Tax=Gossypium australe TaxID=47621 RepID=A0A5B6WSD5_9ROSI|nr:Ribonuclease H-like superfamily protein [Gossypium australe]
MLAKQFWRLLLHTNSLLARLLEAYEGHNPSFIYKSVIVSKHVLLKGICWHIGDGRRLLTSFNWMGCVGIKDWKMVQAFFDWFHRSFVTDSLVRNASKKPPGGWLKCKVDAANFREEIKAVGQRWSVIQMYSSFNKGIRVAVVIMTNDGVTTRQKKEMGLMQLELTQLKEFS